MKPVLAFAFSLLSLLCFAFTCRTTMVQHMVNEHPYILGLGGAFWLCACCIFAVVSAALWVSFIRSHPLRSFDWLLIVGSGICCSPPLILLAGFLTGPLYRHIHQ